MHTSDWHIGKQIGNMRIPDVHEAFMGFLRQIVIDRQVDVLLISGDVFDTRSPSAQSQKMFYGHMFDLLQTTGLSHIVVTSGNHDSPAVLSMLARIFSPYGLHIVTSCNPADELLTLTDRNGKPALQVLAAPFLREREIRNSQGEASTQDLRAALSNAIAAHFRHAQELMEAKFDPLLPTIGMAHLSAAGSSAESIDKGAGVRDLYIGGLDTVNPSIFPAFCDYMALGHIHLPHVVAQNEAIRYCGSPISLGFGEHGRKQMLLIDFDGKTPKVSPVAIPCFLSLLQATGTGLDEILTKIDTYAKERKNLTDLVRPTTYVEIIYKGEKPLPSLKKDVQDHLSALDGEWVLSQIKSLRSLGKLTAQDASIRLDELTPEIVFEQIVGKDNALRYKPLFDLAYAAALAAKAEET